jgi:hypothetical protein
MGNAAKTLRDGDSNNKPFRGFGYFFRAPLPVHGPTARRRPWVGRPWPPTVYTVLGWQAASLRDTKAMDSLLQLPIHVQTVYPSAEVPNINKVSTAEQTRSGQPALPRLYFPTRGWGREEQEWFVQWNTHKADDWVLRMWARRVARDRILVDLWGPLCKLNIELALWKVPCRNRPNRTVRSLGKLHSREGARKASIGKEPDTEQVRWHRRAPKLQGG